ncbi:hypothetical protein A5844_000618 [Enterococcus sp. 10A9_DIV0425]|uniref:Uncharacterized protein n=1 Tax=Candidatus Enterococcus wittei TaxID=1987383 RepID=A0A2C9XQB2_9ENTE|nr:DUF916 and DUF3324 domain-containing protein [Enterococcus sp. 10A9_DIV0425]OTP12385.1 hypothetical protein A5844_000618 [Enterococcus sp. 10A9_DIV0425]THE12281.1 DUF916 and DUF3324 domain-containing protein [Enterococcus hirae]
MRKILFTFLLVFAIVFPQPLFADTEEQVGFHIKAIIPENQIDKKLSYFDLRLDPGQKQTIEFELSNTSKEESTFTIAVNQAYTNDQGFIDYTQPNNNEIVPEPFRIDKIVKVQNQITLAGESSQKVSVELTMPHEAFNGQILSAIHVMKENQKAEEGQIASNYGYVLGLRLANNMNEVQRKIELIEVDPAVSFGKTSVVALLKNPTMDAIGHLKYKAEVKAENGEVVKVVNYDNNMQMAPMSTYRFAIDWDNERLEAGKYSLYLKINDAKDNEWIFDRDFEITEEQANEVNKIAITEIDQQTLPTWVFIVGGVLLALLFILLLYLWYTRKKKKEENEN